jgi:biopolymer transport protein ExbB
MENNDYLASLPIESELAFQASFLGIANPLQSLRELVEIGGPVVAILLIFSIVAVAVIILKIIQLRSAILPPQHLLNEANILCADGAMNEARRLFRAAPGPVAYLSAVAIEAKLSFLDVVAAREKIAVAARGCVAAMRSHLRVLEVISQVAPLLGLFGTILGMIEVFRVLEGSGDVVSPSELAGGIWVALMTTATGLGVAIPAAISLQWFDGIIERQAQAMEENVTTILIGQHIPASDQQIQPGSMAAYDQPLPVAGE